MRRKAQESDIIIVNHHLFFADLAVRQQAGGAPDAGVLPEAGAVIFDEAHELEEVASSYFSISVRNVRFEALTRDLEAMLNNGDAYTNTLHTAILVSSQQLRDRTLFFF